MATRRDGRSTGVQRIGDEKVADALGDFVEGFTSSAGMAADLVLIEDQRQFIGQHPNHREDHQRSALVGGGMLEIAVDGDGLKHFGVDSPAGSAELMNEQRRYGAEVEIGSVEVGVEFHGLHVSLRERDVAAGAELLRGGVQLGFRAGRVAQNMRLHRSASGLLRLEREQVLPLARAGARELELPPSCSPTFP